MYKYYFNQIRNGNVVLQICLVGAIATTAILIFSFGWRAKRAKIQVATGWYSLLFPLDPGDFCDLPWYNYCLYPNRFVNLAAARSQIYNPGLCKKYPWDFEFSARFSRVKANVDWAAKMLLNPFKACKFSLLEGIFFIKFAAWGKAESCNYEKRQL